MPFTATEIAAMRPELAPAIYRPGQDPLVEDLLSLVQDVRDNKRQGDAARDKEIERIKQVDPKAKVVKEIRVYAPSVPDLEYMVADIIFRGSGVSQFVIVEVKTGEAQLSPQQAAILGEALKTSEIYISNEEAANTLEIRPNVTLKDQQIQPLVQVTGGAHATIVRQLMNQGVDVGGPRSRFRLGIPPN